MFREKGCCGDCLGSILVMVFNLAAVCVLSWISARRARGSYSSPIAMQAVLDSRSFSSHGLWSRSRFAAEAVVDFDGGRRPRGTARAGMERGGRKRVDGRTTLACPCLIKVAAGCVDRAWSSADAEGGCWIVAATEVFLAGGRVE